MLNHDINYVVAGRGRPMSAGQIDTVQEIIDTAKEYLDIENQFRELRDNDRISRELFESYQEALLDDRIEGFFAVDRYVDSLREIIDWSGRDITNMTFAEVQQLVNDHVHLYRDEHLFDLVGRNPQNSSLAELEEIAYNVELRFWYSLYRTTQAADVILEEGPEFITEVMDAAASRGLTESVDRLSKGDVVGAAASGIGYGIAMVGSGFGDYVAGTLAIGDGIVDGIETIAYGETHEVSPLARVIRGAYQVGTFLVSKGAKGKAARHVKNEALHTSLFQNVSPKYRNTLVGLSALSGMSIEDLIGLWSSSPTSLGINKLMGVLPTPDEVEKFADALLNPNSKYSAEDVLRATELGKIVGPIYDAIPRPSDEEDIGMNYAQPEMPDVNSILEAQPWVESAEYFVREGDHCFAMELYNEAFAIYPDLKGEIDQPGTHYQEAFNNCQG